METDDIAKATASDWRPERSEQLLGVIGKLGEEACELGGRCCRAVIQGIDGIDPDKGVTNRAILAQEIADVKATILLAEQYLHLDLKEIGRRRDLKVAFKQPWLEGLKP